MASFSFIGKRIQIRKEIQEIQLGIDMAVPLGFILTELISNCYKHAFLKRRYGEIAVSVRCAGDKQLELVVKDDGVGIPEGMGFEDSDSLGYQLIRIFVKQLNGEIEIFRQEGTEVRINFPMM
jgi:two-component sensor histidine kinase